MNRSWPLERMRSGGGIRPVGRPHHGYMPAVFCFGDTIGKMAGAEMAASFRSSCEPTNVATVSMTSATTPMG